MVDSFFEGVMNGIFNLVASLTNIILIPINTLLYTFLPDTTVTSFINGVNSAWNWLGSIGTWAISWFGFTTVQLNVIKMLVIYMLSAPLLVKGIKLALSWYNHLKF